VSLPSTLNQEPFEWRGLKFKWSHYRSAWMTALALGRPPDLDHWLFVQTDGTYFKGWFEFDGGYTLPCTMKSRDDALERARLVLIEYHVEIAGKLRELQP
jgi:hypothetical protein